MCVCVCVLVCVCVCVCVCMLECVCVCVCVHACCPAGGCEHSRTALLTHSVSSFKKRYASKAHIRDSRQQRGKTRRSKIKGVHKYRPRPCLSPHQGDHQGDHQGARLPNMNFMTWWSYVLCLLVLSGRVG